MLTIAGKAQLKSMTVDCPDELPRVVLKIVIPTTDTTPVCAALGVEPSPLEWAWAGDDPALILESIKLKKRRWEGKHTANIGGYELRPTWVQVDSVVPVQGGCWSVEVKVQIDDPTPGAAETWMMHIKRGMPVRLIQDDEPGTPDLFRGAP